LGRKRTILIVSLLILITLLSMISFLFLLDFDGDGLFGLDELNIGTDFFESDSDHDGIDDGAEVEQHFDPLSADMDGDGLEDGEELIFKTSPWLSDTDADGWDDYHESFVTNTSPSNEDTDDDWILDPVDSYPKDFLVPETFRILSFNSSFSEQSNREYWNYIVGFDVSISVTRKPFKSEDVFFLLNGTLTLDGMNITAFPYIIRARTAHENPVVKIGSAARYLRNGTHTLSYRNSTFIFETKKPTFPDEITSKWVYKSEMEGILADTISAVAPHKYFGLVLIFGVSEYTRDTLGLRVYVFKGCSIEKSEIQKTQEELSLVTRRLLLDIANLNLETCQPRPSESIFETELIGEKGYWHTEDHPEYRMYYEVADFAFIGQLEEYRYQKSIDFTGLRIPEKYVSVASSAISLVQGEIAYIPLFVYLSFPESTITVLREISEANSIPLEDAIPIFKPWESKFSKYPTNHVYYKLNAMSLTTNFVKLLAGDISQIPSILLYGVAFYDLRLLLGKLYAFEKQ
jgi:hypothetical protein